MVYMHYHIAMKLCWCGTVEPTVQGMKVFTHHENLVNFHYLIVQLNADRALLTGCKYS